MYGSYYNAEVVGEVTWAVRLLAQATSHGLTPREHRRMMQTAWCNPMDVHLLHMTLAGCPELDQKLVQELTDNYQAWLEGKRNPIGSAEQDIITKAAEIYELIDMPAAKPPSRFKNPSHVRRWMQSVRHNFSPQTEPGWFQPGLEGPWLKSSPGHAKWILIERELDQLVLLNIRWDSHKHDRDEIDREAVRLAKSRLLSK